MNQSCFCFALAIALGASLAGPAIAAERAAVIPLAATGDVTAPVAEQLRAALRRVAASEAELLPPAEVDAAMARANVAVGCRTEACGAGIANAAGARFVISGTVSSVDEIYTVELSLYDHSTQASRSAKGTCELCATSEVDRTVATAFAGLAPGLRVAVAPAPVTPTAPEQIAVEITTAPEGARISVDGVAKGQAPIVVRVTPGTHVIAAERDGFERAERSISALDRPVKLAFRLMPATPVASAVAPPIASAPAPVAPIVTPAAPSPGSGLLSPGIGMLIGGALLTGGGAFLIIIDGDVTCTDGRGRRECPTVFNTKALGMGAFGAGAALIGAGTVMVVLHALADEPAVTPTVGPAAAGGGAMMGFSGRF